MAKKSVGYVELQWTCPNCDTRNPGSQRICANCGSPQPDNVEFEQAAHTELIEDETKLAEAKSAPDIHCYYCGTRNPAGTANCSQCGADLSEGAIRKRGQVVGAHRTGPAQNIICPNCSTENTPNASNCVSCGASLVEAEPKPQPQPQRSTSQAKPSPTAGSSKFIGIGIGLVVLLFCGVIGLFIFLSGRTEPITGRVQDVEWSRSIIVEGLVPVTREAWRSDVPAGVVVGSCQPRLHHTQDEPAPNAEEVCGTPYVIDQGSGFGEVIQDCQYRVYEDFCEYQATEWQQVDTFSETGDNFTPIWPALSLNESDQREGQREETYEVEFITEDGRYTYTTRDPIEFAQYQIGSSWILNVNTFNAVMSTEPAN